MGDAEQGIQDAQKVKAVQQIYRKEEEMTNGSEANKWHDR
jgi:hypothetical protein